MFSFNRVEAAEKRTALDDLQIIVVSVSNPATAPVLLRLATAMIDPQDGQIIALFVSLKTDEEQNELSDDIEQVVKDFREDGWNVELLVRRSETVARSILEVAREVRSDLIIMGMSTTNEHHPIVRNVLAAAPCGVTLYCTHENDEFKRIVVPVDRSEHARIACQVGLRLSRFFKVGMTILAVRRHGRTTAESEAYLDYALRHLRGAGRVRRVVVPSADPLDGLLSQVNEHDLILLGFAQKDTLEKWLFSDFSRPLFENAPCPIALTTKPVNGHDSFTRWLQRRWKWLFPTLTDLEQEELVWTAQEQASPSLDYLVLMMIAAPIACAGLLLNNATMIIGATLIAPMRAPIMAFAIGLTTGRVDIMRQAIPTTFLGMLFALVIALIVGGLNHLNTPTAEMMTWSQPTLLDAIVALAAGLMGAYAAARKHISEAPAGVAIAATLTIAVCTAGLSITAGNFEMALGAGLLFLTNFVCISLSAWAGFFWMGMRPRVIERSRRRLYISMAIVMLLAFPLVTALLNLSNRQGAEGVIEERLEEAFAPAEVVEVTVMDGETLEVLATVRSVEPITSVMVGIIEDTLASELQRPIDLEVVALAVVTGD